ncbi:AAA family ATPase [Pseudomonas veronii]|uniref:ATP-binding protein n=1 Tax=Pseudomonas veronii TaxID=76761 RepID=UPI001E2B9613|nr:ATP-binding protein [Pseudomonas veronii]UHH33034.1 AAA family ATPase [Pseudomonas veronii]
MFIESVVVSGPDLPDAAVYFTKGANVVQGGSDTGKSYIVQCIKFALGSSKPPKPIEVSKGYTTVRVKFANDDESAFTIERPLAENSKATLIDEQGRTSVLGTKHSASNKSTLSSQFLDKLGLDGKLLLLGSESLRSGTFSLRDFEKIFLIDESRIVAEYSPLGTGQVMEKTKENSILKLLLTGKDDSAVKSAKKDLESKGALKHKFTAVEEIISKFYPGEDATQILQLQKLHSFNNQVVGRLEQAEADLKSAFQSSEGLFDRKGLHTSELEVVDVKIAEDKALLGRFDMLGKKYESDRQRLLGIEQAAVLLDASDSMLCPTCGSHFDSESCMANMDDIKDGVAFELSRISKNIQELAEAQGSLSVAIERNTSTALTIKAAITALEKQIAVELEESVQVVSDLKELSSSIKRDLSSMDQRVADRAKLSDELKRLGALLLEEQVSYTAESFEEAVTPLVAEIESILERWGFPGYLPVDFDFKARDITIGGSARGNFGKGYRAIAFSAFVLGLMNLLKLSGRHPGFVVLDSPLTTYKEGDGQPEDEADAITGDLIYGFYRDIADNFRDYQIIIFENKEPDPSVIPMLNYQHFTKNRNNGRYGFFALRD